VCGVAIYRVSSTEIVIIQQFDLVELVDSVQTCLISLSSQTRLRIASLEFSSNIENKIVTASENVCSSNNGRKSIVFIVFSLRNNKTYN
jgi:hypothetical protein